MVLDKYQYFRHISKYLCFFILALSCANVKPPPGGPVDKTPPEVVQTIPESGATQVDPKIKIEAKFSEGINPKSVENSVFITPFPEEDTKIKCHSKKITVTFPQPLKANQTYVVTFGTGIKDYRGNALAASITLAFSTGKKLDQGEIQGRVFGYKDATGVGVWAYALSDTAQPNPFITEPDYIVQCDVMGNYQFSYLAPGRYRLFAIRDRLSDRLYQKVEDEIGLTSSDPVITQEKLKSGPFTFRMTKEDTLRPALVRAIPLNQNRVTLRFSEPVVMTSHQIEKNVFCTASNDSLDTLKVQNGYLDSRDNRLFHLLTEPQKLEKSYRVHVTTFQDSTGNELLTDGRMTEFAGVIQKDTTSPEILFVSPKQKEQLVALNNQFQLVFNESVDSTQLIKKISWSDTLENPVHFQTVWKNPADVLFIPKTQLESKKIYRVMIDSSGVMDLAGNGADDTTFTFKTINADTLSEISGTVLDSNQSVKGPVYLKLKQTEDPAIQYNTMISEPGLYCFSEVLPGHYLIHCFRDEDTNGSYSFGTVDPFQHSERFYVYPDTISVRSRWPNEGNDFILP